VRAKFPVTAGSTQSETPWRTVAAETAALVTGTESGLEIGWPRQRRETALLAVAQVARTRRDGPGIPGSPSATEVSLNG